MLRQLVLLILAVGTVVAFVPPLSSSSFSLGCPRHRCAVLHHDDRFHVPMLVQATRRDVLEHGGNQAAFWVAAGAGSTATHPATAAAATTTATPPTTTTSTSTSTSTTSLSANLIADLPMIRLKLPRGGFGREFIALDVMIGDNNAGPYTFMVDTGLTTEMITPHLQQELMSEATNKKSSKPMTIQGMAAGGATNNPLVELTDVSLITTAGDRVPLPGVLHAVVTDFPQEHMDPAHDPVEGMMGMEALRLFDVDLDFPAGRIRLYRPGTVREVAQMAGLVEIPAVVINETGLLGIRVATATTKGGKKNALPPQPILGFLDCGATFSVVNTAATRYLGLPTDPTDTLYQRGPVVAGIGIDGQPIQLPTASTTLTFAGNVVADPTTGRPTGFAPPPAAWKPWDAVSVAVGDIPAFSTILGDGTKPYQGPAALIGLDVLAQRRVILETVPPGTSTRQRRVWVSPK
mmetsp:Transcript_1249/g.2468  ORF Transcript_1249/g.2468 Transcript_1249/m.2468 type:complete len:462 (-) Transcript_1249:326-1711(-)